MNIEDKKWTLLSDHASSQIRPGFADRVLREAQTEAPPLIATEFVMCLATAALCCVAVFIYRSGSSVQNDANLASWGEVVAQADQIEQGL